jgi:hypothetical protein
MEIGLEGYSIQLSTKPIISYEITYRKLILKNQLNYF